MSLLKTLFDQGKSQEILKRKSREKEAVKALQHSLYKLGYGKELNWERFGADGDYGMSTAAAVRAFADKEGIQTDGDSIPPALLQRILEKTPTEDTSTAAAQPAVRLSNVFRKHKKGVYTVGKSKPAEFIEKNPDKLKAIGLTDSLIRIMAAVSQNEGNLDAINTWDDSFITFGMFQWSLGQGDGKGELPALINLIKSDTPAAFNKYFSSHGLDVSAPHTDKVYGHFTLNYLPVDQASKKERLRSDEWAQRFWEAGLDPDVQTVQVKHAAARLWTFYWRTGKAPITYRLSDLVSSELGVALLLDNHVNRPGYVRTCIERAMTQTGLSNPENWTTVEEQKLLRAYLDIRKVHGKYPMTHADKRAQRMLAANLSPERGSFTFDHAAPKSLFDTGPKLPVNYSEEEYPEIQWDENEADKKQPDN
jgi:hypothetical protein